MASFVLLRDNPLRHYCCDVVQFHKPADAVGARAFGGPTKIGPNYLKPGSTSGQSFISQGRLNLDRREGSIRKPTMSGFARS
jgi:hypothetical protein